MSSVLGILRVTPLLNDMDALYQRVYGTPERMQKTDRFLARVIVLMSVITLLQAQLHHNVCGTGTL